MPTGYTYKVENGEITELKDFVLECAQGFGPFVHKNSDNLDYYKNEVEEAKKEVLKLQNFTDKEVEEKLREEYAMQKERLEKRMQEIMENNVRYQTMINKVSQWTPPTDDHIKLKNFMLQQLEDSKYSDGCIRYYQQELSKYSQLQNVEDYRKQKLEKAMKNVLFYEDLLKNNEKAYVHNNQWVNDLMNSL